MSPRRGLAEAEPPSRHGINPTAKRFPLSGQCQEFALGVAKVVSLRDVRY